MTNETRDLDLLDAAVLAVWRAMTRGEDFEAISEWHLVQAAQRLAAEREAARLGRPLAELERDEDWDPLPLSKLFDATLSRQRAILEHALDTYLDSRGLDAEQSHVLQVEPAATLQRADDPAAQWRLT